MTQKNNLSASKVFYSIYRSGFGLFLERSSENRQLNEKYCEWGKTKIGWVEGAKRLTFSPSLFARIAIFFAKIITKK